MVPCAYVAQLDRATVFYTAGWGFESLRGHNIVEKIMNNDSRLVTLQIHVPTDIKSTNSSKFATFCDGIAHKLQTYGAKHIKLDFNVLPIITFKFEMLLSKISELRFFDHNNKFYIERGGDRRKYNLLSTAGNVFTEKRVSNRRIN